MTAPARSRARARVTRAVLRSRLAALPRARLARLPTPLEPAPRFSEDIGLQVWFKRDDLTGMMLSGNKSRVIEYVLGDALEQGADRILVGGPVESNYHRVLAAAANKHGIQAVPVLRGERRDDVGNLLLTRLLGADVRFTDAADRPANEAAKDAVAEELRAQGHRPYIIRGDFASSAQAVLGCVAYVAAAYEIAEQCRRQQVHPDVVCVASTGPTWAGLCLGFDLLGCPLSVYGVGYVEPAPQALEYSSWLTTEACARLQLPRPPGGPHVFDDRYLDYRHAGSLAREAFTRVARTEGVLLDPLYTSRAMGALLRAHREGRIPDSARVIFVHSGGIPALFDRGLLAAVAG